MSSPSPLNFSPPSPARTPSLIESATQTPSPRDFSSSNLPPHETSSLFGARSSQGSSRAAPRQKARLTETQRRMNHVDSERKRRDGIRDSFIELTKLVPGTKGSERTEGFLLRMYNEYAKEMIDERLYLIEQLEGQGQYVEPCYKDLKL